MKNRILIYMIVGFLILAGFHVLACSTNERLSNLLQLREATIASQNKVIDRLKEGRAAEERPRWDGKIYFLRNSDEI